MRAVGAAALGVALAAAGSVSGATSGSRQREAESPKIRLARLKAQAASPESEEALDALEQIARMGPAVREDLRLLLRQRLARSGYAIEAAVRACGSVEAYDKAFKELTDLRARARANIAALSKEDDSIARAERFYKDLLDRTRRITPRLAARSRLADLAVERICLLALQKQFPATTREVERTARPGPKPLDLAGKTLGVDFHDLPGRDALETHPALKPVMEYRFNRRVQAYNRPLLRQLHPEEARNILIVNDYREALGLRRLEVDLRLVQSARRHSREMVEKGYFSHQSPTKGLQSPWDRMKAAGYPGGGGENIAAGRTRGADVFQMWFHSPGHHKNMASARYKAIGVGKWGRNFTQNFGSAPRLMDAPEAVRKAAVPKGELLPRER